MEIDFTLQISPNMYTFFRRYFYKTRYDWILEIANVTVVGCGLK